MNSILNYLGGKSYIADDLVKRFPKNHKVYVDVFGGAAWVLLARHKDSSIIEVYNDRDEELSNLFTVIRDKKVEYLKKWEYSIVSRKIFDDLVDSNPKDLNDIDRAYRTLYLWKYAFSGRRNSDYSFNFGYSIVRFPTSIDNIIEGINSLHNRIKNVFIENLDYKDCLKKYNDETVFVYADPPYIIQDVNTNYYKYNMNKEEEHIELKENLSKIKGKFMISLPYSDFYLKLYKDYHFEEINVNYVVGVINEANGIRKELIITNYEYETMHQTSLL